MALIVLTLGLLSCKVRGQLSKGSFSSSWSDQWQGDTFGRNGFRNNWKMDTILEGMARDQVLELIGLPADSSYSSRTRRSNWIYILSTDYCKHRDSIPSSVWNYPATLLELQLDSGKVAGVAYSIAE